MFALFVLLIVVVVFSTVQSLFGVGLLVFGTPTLLLLGYPFDSTIALLLPSSIAISTMQVLAGKERIQEIKTSFVLYSIPFIAIGLALVLSSVLVFDMKLGVGLMLIVTAVLRYIETIQQWFARFLRKRLNLYLMGMGLIHGLSNMGGGLLTILVSTIYSDKEVIRANIAFGYLVFALSQIAVLLILKPSVLSLQSLVLAGAALVTYKTLGNAVFRKSPGAAYQHMITAFILVYGVVLVGQQVVWYSAYQ
jgi:hypothetical protein